MRRMRRMGVHWWVDWGRDRVNLIRKGSALRWVFVVGLLGGCASAGGGSAGQAEQARAAAGGEESCRVEIQNGTPYALTIRYQAGVTRGNLDTAGPGASVAVSVPCTARRVLAVGSPTETNGESGRYSRSAELEAGATTVIKLTSADRVR